MAKRTNDEWKAALSRPGPEYDSAVDDLRTELVQGLRYALGGRSGADDAVLEDFAQDAILRILGAIESFREESKFTTWAHKIAVRVAYTELRRHRWRDVSLEEMTEVPAAGFMPNVMADPSIGPEQQALQHSVLETLQRSIATELTDKQRQALVAIRIHGVPLEEFARRSGTNRNAVYKLLHDARQRLKKHLMDAGLSAEDVLAAFDGR